MASTDTIIDIFRDFYNGVTAIKTKITDGTLNVSLLNSAPASDTGQVALPVRVVSQLGAGSGGGTASSVAINDGTTTTQKASVSVSGALKVDGSAVTQPVSGTFWQATQPVSIASMPSTPVTGTFWQDTQPVSIATMPSTPVTGTFWQATQPVSGTVSANATLSAETTKVIGTINVAASQTIAVTQATAANLNATVVQATPANLQATATPIAITKGTQGATGFTTQDLKDAGRNQTNYFMALPIVTTTSDVLMSLTGYKAGAAVAATTTPAVVTSGKTYRIQSITITYVAIATAGSVLVKLRANTGGVVAVTSPVVDTWVVGGPAAVAGVAFSVSIPITDGMEFAAGTGIGITISGLGATQAAAAVGYGQVAIKGYEY